jgi:ADP-ribosylglycohydrolase
MAMTAELAALPAHANVAVVTMRGSLCPITLGHVRCFEEARQLLLGLGGSLPAGVEPFAHTVGFLSLNPDHHLRAKFAGKRGKKPLGLADREMLVRVATAEMAWLELSTCKQTSRDVARLRQQFPQLNFDHFDMNGADDVVKYSKWTRAGPSHKMITMGRPGSTLALLRGMARVGIAATGSADFLLGPELPDVSSTKLRAASQRGDQYELLTLCHPKVAEWMLVRDGHVVEEGIPPMQPARRPCAELMECPADDDPGTSDTDDEPLFTEPTRARALDDEPLFESATTAYDGHQQPVRGGEAPPPACNEVGSGELMECWGGVDGPCPLDSSLFQLDVHLPARSDAAMTTFASLSGASLLSRIPAADKTALVSRLVTECPRSSVAKAVGSMVALAAADATGHWFEFMDACDKQGENSGRSVFNISKLQYVPPLSFTDPRKDPPACFSGTVLNRFALHMGQWTDDCSMSLCIADSLLVKQRYDGSDIRIRFWNWWNKGYCNAFGKEAARGRPRRSVGLGGNISKSISSMVECQIPTPTFESSGQDSGNGSLMRLAPIAIFYSADETACMHYARESSYTTHPGRIAAECCAFQAFLIARAIHDPQLPIEVPAATGVAAAGAGVRLTARSWLEKQVHEYLETHLKGRGGVGVNEVRRLLLSAEPEGSLERCASRVVSWLKASKLNARSAVAGTGTGARLRRKGFRSKKHLNSEGADTMATQYPPATLVPTPWTAWRWRFIVLPPRTALTPQ